MRTTIRSASEIERKYLLNLDPVYHYTSPDSMIQILEKRQLWFTRFDCLNDAGEGKYIQSVFSKVIQRFREEGGTDESFLNEIEGIIPNYHFYFRILDNTLKEYEDDEVSYAEDKKSKPYLCCFSKKNDLLPMWNYYSKNNRFEGYNLGFSFNEMVRNHENIDLFQIVYDENDQISIIKDDIEIVYENYTVNHHGIDTCKQRLNSILSRRSMQFKDKAFKNEEEVRLVYWEPEDDNNLVIDSKPIKYRSKCGIVIPYIEVEFERKQIESLMIGPLIQTEIAEKTVKELLKSNDYSDVKVEHSRIPIRY